MVSHWAWSDEGWMKFIYCLSVDTNTGQVVVDNSPNTTLVCLGYKDFGGSGVVHVLAGTCAIIGCYFMGPRKGRFTADGKPGENIQGHSVPLTALGGYILIFGFLAFNGGSQVLQ